MLPKSPRSIPLTMYSPARDCQPRPVARRPAAYDIGILIEIPTFGFSAFGRPFLLIYSLNCANPRATGFPGTKSSNSCTSFISKAGASFITAFISGVIFNLLFFIAHSPLRIIVPLENCYQMHLVVAWRETWVKTFAFHHCESNVSFFAIIPPYIRFVES